MVLCASPTCVGLPRRDADAARKIAAFATAAMTQKGKNGTLKCVKVPRNGRVAALNESQNESRRLPAPDRPKSSSCLGQSAKHCQQYLELAEPGRRPLYNLAANEIA